MALHASDHIETPEARASHARRMARFVLLRSSRVPVGREGSSEAPGRAQGGHNGLYKAGSTGNVPIIVSSVQECFSSARICLTVDLANCAIQRVLAHHEEQALLKAYITEWRKFFTQCNYLPTPFRQLETSLAGKPSSSIQKKNQQDESIVRKVSARLFAR